MKIMGHHSIIHTKGVNLFFKSLFMNMIKENRVFSGLQCRKPRVIDRKDADEFLHAFQLPPL